MEQMTSICDMVGQIMQKKEEERRIVEEQAAKEDMSIEEMRHEQQLVDYEIKDITNDLGYKRFRGEKIDEEYKRDSITLDLPIEEPDNSLNMRDEHLNTIPETESDEVIKSSVENLVPIPSEFEGISNDTSDVCQKWSFAGETRLNIAPIPPGIVEANFYLNDDTSSNDDSFEYIEYVDATPSYSELVNDVDQEEKEFDLKDIFQIQDVILREKLLNVPRLFPNIEFFETIITENEEVQTTTHANYSLPDYDSFLFEIEPDQEVLISIDNSNNTLLELPEFKSFHFDPLFPRPPPEPPDVEKCLEPKAGILITKVFKGVSKSHDFRDDILPTLPTLVSDLTFILFLSSFFSFGSEDTT
ncbi:hypothetical protein Tco_1235532 [Tanacetum coccineum]